VPSRTDRDGALSAPTVQTLRLIELAWDEIPVLVISGNELPVYAGERPLGQKTDSLQKC